MPCRGSGRVVSNLGGKSQEVTCPWCGGEKVRLPEVDAQTKWLEKAARAQAPKVTPTRM
ncbi:MAG TPA: hypothetical protein VMS02_04320 [Solirubrobacteraceae bacterium]|nr:hypothetical protein [Solirubrobacteraceae bacterium]